MQPTPTRSRGGAVIHTVGVNHESRSIDDVKNALMAVRAASAANGTSDGAADPAADSDPVVVVASSADREACKALRAQRASHPGRAVVLVVDKADRTSLQKAVRAGAGAVVLRPTVGTTLGPALRAAETSLVAVPRELALDGSGPVLTTREKQILGMLVLGFSNGEIARKLHIAESTVKSHLSAAFTKLGVRSRNEAVAAILGPNTGLGPGVLSISQQERRPLRAAGSASAGSTARKPRDEGS